MKLTHTINSAALFCIFAAAIMTFLKKTDQRPDRIKQDNDCADDFHSGNGIFKNQLEK